MNQDSRRKLKQVYHLFQFIEPLLKDVQAQRGAVTLADHGAGKSYLGFILYDLFFKEQPEAQRQGSHIYGIETREELVKSSEELARRLGFGGMSFLNLSVAESITSDKLPRPSTWSPPCTPATPPPTTRSVSRWRKRPGTSWSCPAARRKWRRYCARTRPRHWPIRWRKSGGIRCTRGSSGARSPMLRCLQLEAHGYQVSVTELVGWEHSMKNELIIAQYKDLPRRKPAERLREMLERIGLQELKERFFWLRGEAGGCD